MYKGHRILALIPARGGSKGLPHKNVKPFLGKPLIAWTIEETKKVKWIDAVIVSTDDQRIAAESGKRGAEVPFMRPGSLATDRAQMRNVILHAMRWTEVHREKYDFLILLQPTSPLRTAADIENAIRLLFRKKAQAIVSVCESKHHPRWMNQIPKSGCLRSFLGKSDGEKNRQALGRFYRLNGAVYLAAWDYFIRNKSFFGAKTYAYCMPTERSIDIDDRQDFLFAEAWLLRARKKNRKISRKKKR